MIEKKRHFCQSCGEFIGEYEPGSVPPCRHCNDKKNTPIPLQLSVPQGQFYIDSIDFSRLTSIKFELFKVIDPRPRVGELKNMGGYAGIYEKVFGRELNFFAGDGLNFMVSRFIEDSKQMASIWILENCQEYPVPVMVKITPGYGVEK